MNRPRQFPGLWVAGILALIAFGIFLLINPRQPAVEHRASATPTPSPPPAPNYTESLERAEAPPTPHRVTPEPAPPKQVPPSLPAATANILTTPTDLKHDQSNNVGQGIEDGGKQLE